ncbi:MAG: nickel pincer cofactor biosynthesis protein LarC [Syntrophomonadaceae bacterium]|nr:nickel pincer cofactor biosynthesis protein LarC [Syntrophomonadaceae bacterium]MDD3023538.1 nickel pincer cofactor biosynthesis protein LarC [Syntrophomonadaceae bacterium]
MSIIYFDCFSGVAGDMIIASLLDLGIDFEIFNQEIAKLGLETGLSCQKVNVSGIMGSRFIIDNTDSSRHRHLSDIFRIIEQSTLNPDVKEKSLAVFTKLAEAEAHVHGIPLEKVHFHEIGAVDTIIDIVGTFICLNLLDIKQVFSSPLPWSKGFVDIDHGRYPLPAPAAALLLKGIPAFPTNCEMELVTPTGAAIITSLTASFGTMPQCTPQEIGYGAGSKPRADRIPNLLRAVKASLSCHSQTNQEMVAVLEAEIDDLNPELMGYLFEKLLLEEDVLDLFTTPVLMKKNRHGFLITVIANTKATEKVAGILFRESSTLGVRHRLQTRSVLLRHHESIHTPWGTVRIKIARLPGGGSRVKPEFEDCRSIAVTHNIPLQQVYAAVNKLLQLQELDKY